MCSNTIIVKVSRIIRGAIEVILTIIMINPFIELRIKQILKIINFFVFDSKILEVFDVV